MVPQPPITTLEAKHFLDTLFVVRCHKSLINLAHLEGFEPPTTWLEAACSFAEFTAEPCGLFYIEPPNEIRDAGR